ncbi:MAG: NADH-quinone oxidoreductase subunit D [Planctomycetes bacterium]|nr:NADH-quinone oxidoreductase subunit D [Planctomycetota bacterium]
MLRTLQVERRVDPHLSIDRYDPEAELLLLHFGPQHPATHGVFRMDLYLDGEIVVKCVPYVGYLHRAVEKLCEVLTYSQVTPIVDKNDYVSPMTNEQAINLAFEKLLGLEVPRRARWIRTVFAEMQRIASHLLWLGTFAMDLGGALGGGATVFMHAFRERESIMDLFEEVSGSRFHYNTHTIGGNRHDIPAGWSGRVKQALDVIEARIGEYEAMTLENRIFHERTRGVGVLDGTLALELGITGPNLRASGVDHDLRRDAPFHAYDEITVNVITAEGGDCLARTQVRMGELRESIRIVRAMIDSIPEGPINGGKPIKLVNSIKIPAGQTYVAMETPRGELGTYLIADGSPKAQRLKIRPPSLHALSAMPYILPGGTVSDALAILGSLDPIMGEVDR